MARRSDPKGPKAGQAKPPKLRPERVLQLARECLGGAARRGVVWNPHLWKDHPERLVRQHHVVRGILAAKARVERSRAVFKPQHGKWSYLVETELFGHRLHVVVAFHPPLPGDDDVVALEFVTAYFPDEPDGALPADLR